MAANGRDAASPAEMPARGWWQVLKRTYVEAADDNLGLVAAGVAFYGFLALVPALAAMVLTYGLVFDASDVARQMEAVTGQIPADAAKLIQEQLTTVAKTASEKQGFGLAIALALAFYGAMQGAGGLVVALNIVNDEKETRGFVRTTLLNAAVTLAAVLLAVAFLLAGSVTAFLEHVVQDLGEGGLLAVKLGSLVTAAVLASAAVAALYRYGPNRASARWSWLTPGSVMATVGLVAATAGFGWYAANFGNYNATYGSLGAVVVLLFWLYLSAYVLLLGAELNAELEHQTARDTTTGPELPLGQRRAKMADEVAAA